MYNSVDGSIIYKGWVIELILYLIVEELRGKKCGLYILYRGIFSYKECR